jgi:uncharacterized iron-regulated membrane protein
MRKSKRTRELIFQGHRYLGLVLGVLIAIASLTASMMIVMLDTEEFFIQQSVEQVIPQGERLSFEVLVDKAKNDSIAQGYSIVNGISPYTFPNRPLDSPISISLSKPDNEDDWIDVILNPYTGKVLGTAPERQVLETVLNLHYTLLAGKAGESIMGVTGLLGFILMVTGITLWSGWRKLATGFKIKWKGHLKRRNFGIHQVAGIFSGIFLAMALFTGFIYNFPNFTYPLIYRLTFSPVPPEEFVSTPIAGKTPITLTQALNAIKQEIPEGIVTQIDLPQTETDVYQVRKKVPGDWYGNLKFGRSFAYVDHYSGKVLSAVDITKASLGEKIANGMDIFHFGLFGGIFGRILYFCVGLSPTILLITGFTMYRLRRRPQLKTQGESRSIGEA